MKKFRNVLFWCHLIVAIPAALVILIMASTGVLLTYEKQITAWSDKRTYPVQQVGQKLPVSELLSKLQKAEGRNPSNLTLRSDPASPAEARFGRERMLLIDPYTGAILGDGSSGARPFFRSVTDWHRWLGRPDTSRPIGKAITGACNLGFLFLVVSGIYLWWPRNWAKRALRNVVWFRRGLSAKARDFNWHNVIGLWTAIPLLFIVASGVVMSYPWANDLVYRLAGESAPPPRRQEPGGRQGRGGPAGPMNQLDPLWKQAESRASHWTSISLAVPRDAKSPVAFTIDRGMGGQPQLKGTLTFDPLKGDATKWEDFSSGTAGRKARTFLRFAHTGEIGGVLGQTIAGLVSLGTTILAVTGLFLTYRRFRAWLARRGRVGAVVVTEVESETDPERELVAS